MATVSALVAGNLAAIVLAYEACGWQRAVGLSAFSAMIWAIAIYG